MPVFDKYDEFLPSELLKKGFAEGVLDIAGMRRRVLEWADAPVELPGAARELPEPALAPDTIE